MSTRIRLRAEAGSESDAGVETGAGEDVGVAVTVVTGAAMAG